MQRMVIKGSEWNRGGSGAKMSYLLGSDRDRCCIGIHGRICGVPDPMLLDQPSVVTMYEDGGDVDLPECYRVWVNYEDGFIERDSDIAQKAMTINDAIFTSDEEKIALLRPIFRSIGITIVWRPTL